MVKVKYQMCVTFSDDEIANATDDDLIEWLRFEMRAKRERRRLPKPLDGFDATFTHEPKFIGPIKIVRK